MLFAACVSFLLHEKSSQYGMTLIGMRCARTAWARVKSPRRKSVFLAKRLHQKTLTVDFRRRSISFAGGWQTRASSTNPNSHSIFCVNHVAVIQCQEQIFYIYLCVVFLLKRHKKKTFSPPEPICEIHWRSVVIRFNWKLLVMVLYEITACTMTWISTVSNRGREKATKEKKSCKQKIR